MKRLSPYCRRRPRLPATLVLVVAFTLFSAWSRGQPQLRGRKAEEPAGEKMTWKERMVARKLKDRTDSAALTEITDALVATGLKPGEFRRKLKVGQRDRHYDIHIPASYKPGTPTPLVLNLHGGMGNPRQQRRDSKMDAVADKNGFIVIYPAGTGFAENRFLTWNIGLGDTFATKRKIDDEGYIEALLDDAARMVTVDSKRVYMTGFSQGAFMSYQLGNALSDRIAAIAPVSGVLLVPPEKVKLSRPVPVIHFHGKLDPNVAYAGGIGKNAHDKIKRPSVADSVNTWAKACGIADMTPSATKKQGQAELKVYGPGPDGAEIAVWTIANGGHTWPGGMTNLPEERVGKLNKDINASELMWEFFKAHPKP